MTPGFPPARLRFRGRGYALDQDQAQAWRGVEVVEADRDRDVEAVAKAVRDYVYYFGAHTNEVGHWILDGREGKLEQWIADALGRDLP